MGLHVIAGIQGTSLGLGGNLVSAQPDFDLVKSGLQCPLTVRGLAQISTLGGCLMPGFGPFDPTDNATATPMQAFMNAMRVWKTRSWQTFTPNIFDIPADSGSNSFDDAIATGHAYAPLTPIPTGSAYMDYTSSAATIHQTLTTMDLYDSSGNHFMSVSLSDEISVPAQISALLSAFRETPFPTIGSYHDAWVLYSFGSQDASPFDWGSGYLNAAPDSNGNYSYIGPDPWTVYWTNRSLTDLANASHCYTVTSITRLSGGTGYNLGDTLSINGPAPFEWDSPAQIQVTNTGASNAITGEVVLNGGNYETAPTSPATENPLGGGGLSGGSGSWASYSFTTSGPNGVYPFDGNFYPVDLLPIAGMSDMSHGTQFSGGWGFGNFPTLGPGFTASGQLTYVGVNNPNANGAVDINVGVGGFQIDRVKVSCGSVFPFTIFETAIGYDDASGTIANATYFRLVETGLATPGTVIELPVPSLFTPAAGGAPPGLPYLSPVTGRAYSGMSVGFLAGITLEEYVGTLGYGTIVTDW